MVAKIHDYKDKETILNAAKELKKLKKEDEPGIFISEQFPDEIKECRKEAFAKIRANYQLPEKNQEKMKLKLDKLFINGSLDKPSVSRPMVKELTAIDDQQEAKMNKMKYIVGERQSELGNSFQGIAVQVQSLNDVRLALKKVLKHPEFASAAHCMSAYSLRQGDTNVLGHYDDGEFGGGFQLQKALGEHDYGNTAVFVVRQHVPRNFHLGPKRFVHIVEAARSALGNM